MPSADAASSAKRQSTPEGSVTPATTAQPSDCGALDAVARCKVEAGDGSRKALDGGRHDPGSLVNRPAANTIWTAGRTGSAIRDA